MWVKAPEERACLAVMIYPLCQCGFIIQPHKVYRIIWHLFFHGAKAFLILFPHYLSGESSRCFLSCHESMAAQNAIPSAVSFLLIFSNINMQAALFDIFHYTFWHPRTKNRSAYVVRTKNISLTLSLTHVPSSAAVPHGSFLWMKSQFTAQKSVRIKLMTKTWECPIFLSFRPHSVSSCKTVLLTGELCGCSTQTAWTDW